MKNILLYTLLLTATLTYAQGLLPEEKVKKEPSAQPVQQTKKYAWKGEYYEGLAMVRLDKKYGFIDKTGKEVIPIKYNYADRFSEGLALVILDKKYGKENWKKGPKSDYNQIKKAIERGGHKAWNAKK